MVSISTGRRLRKYESLEFNPKKIYMVVDGEAFSLSEKLEDYSKWQTVSGHNFSDFTEPVADEFAGSTEEVEALKSEVAKKVASRLKDYLQKAVSKDISEVKEELVGLEKLPVGLLIKNGKMDEVKAMIFDQVDEWLNQAAIQQLLGDSVSTLNKLRSLFNDQEERAKGFESLMTKLASFKDQVKERFKQELTQENFITFEENLSKLRAQTRFSHIRKLNEGDKPVTLTAKVLYHMHLKDYDVEALYEMLLTQEVKG